MDANGKPITPRELLQRMMHRTESAETALAAEGAHYQTFTKRRRVDKSRQYVGRYKDSRLARLRHQPARPAHTSDDETPTAAAQSAARPDDKKPAVPKNGKNRPSAAHRCQQFREPPSRGYDPFRSA